MKRNRNSRRIKRIRTKRVHGARSVGQHFMTPLRREMVPAFYVLLTFNISGIALCLFASCVFLRSFSAPDHCAVNRQNSFPPLWHAVTRDPRAFQYLCDPFFGSSATNTATQHTQKWLSECLSVHSARAKCVQRMSPKALTQIIRLHD